MEKVYAIISDHYVTNFTSFGELDFVFDSREKAEKQMMDMRNMITSGRWYSKSETTHGVEYYHVQEPDIFGIIITMKINHSNGAYSIYRLQEKEMNRGRFND